MEILADAMPEKAAIPRSTDGMVDIQSLLRLLAEQLVGLATPIWTIPGGTAPPSGTRPATCSLVSSGS